MLNDQDALAVKTAVRAAEKRTRGELYCVIAEESSDYRETPFLWAGLTALAAPPERRQWWIERVRACFAMLS